MSQLRTIAWLVAGIAAVTAVHLLVDVRPDSAPGLRRHSLLPAADRADVLSIARAGSPVTQLRRDTAWKIVEPYAASAEQGLVLRLTDALAFSPISDEMTDAELLRLGRTRRNFGLDQPRVVVSVGRSTQDCVRVAFGDPTPAGDGVYATVGDLPTVYVVSSNVLAAVDLEAADLRRRRLCLVRQEDVLSFDVKQGAGSFVRIVRDGESWRLSDAHGKDVSSSRVRAFLDIVMGLEAGKFVRSVGMADGTKAAPISLLAGYGLDPESSVAVTLKCADARDWTVSFGRETDVGSVYALADGGTSVVTVPTSALEAMKAGLAFFVDARIFPLDAAAVNALSLDDGSVTYLLSRTAEKGWRLDAPVSAAADQDAVEALLGRLLSLKSEAVDAGGVRVALGTNAEPVSVSRSILFADARPEDLRSKVMVNISPKLVKRVVVTDAGKSPVSALFDPERKAWIPERAEADSAVDETALSKLAAALGPLEALRVAQLKVSVSEMGAYGLDKPFRTVAVDQTTENSVRRNILIGDVTDGGRYATVGASDAIFVISSERVAALLAPLAKQ